MRLKTWTCGIIAGISATMVLTIMSLTLYFTGLMPISISEYAARFILHLDEKEMNIFRWIVGFITNLSLGGFFGLLSSFLYKFTGTEEKTAKIITIGISCWFFQLALVPALDPEIAKYSTYDTAIPYFFLYLIWSVVVSLIIFKYLQNED